MKKLASFVSRKLVTNGRLKRIIDRRLNDAAKPVTSGGWPATGSARHFRDFEAIRLNQKAFGQELARGREALLASIPAPHPLLQQLQSKPCTQADMLSPWLLYWCDQLGYRRSFHRAVWESAYVLQALYDGGAISEGKRILSQGGSPDVARYLAQQGCIVVEEAPPNEASDLSSTSDGEFDACWSCSSANRVGSPERAQEFLRGSVERVRQGGFVVHTFEHNIATDMPNLAAGPLILLQRQHVEKIADTLTRAGHTVGPLSFSLGSDPLDRYIDLPPYEASPSDWRAGWAHPLYPAHLRASIHGIPATSFGFHAWREA